jgi:hypothetical protein
VVGRKQPAREALGGAVVVFMMRMGIIMRMAGVGVGRGAHRSCSEFGGRIN